MSVFRNIKTLHYLVTRSGRSEEVPVRFAEHDRQIFVLLSDLWHMSGMEGDRATVVALYVRSCGSNSARHFIFKGSPPEDALLSETVAGRMVADWCGDGSNAIFAAHPLAEMFRDARRAFHGLQIIRGLCERASDPGDRTRFDVIAARLEIDATARTMLNFWGRSGSGFPALRKQEAIFLRSLLMTAGDDRRARKVHHQACRFFDFKSTDVLERIKPPSGPLELALV